MAISTGGISVPQLGGGGGISSDIYGNKEAPKGMTLQQLTDLSRGNIALQKERALLEPGIEKGKAETELAQTTSKKATLGLQKDYFATAADEANALVNDKRLLALNPNDHKSVVAAGDALVDATDRMIKQGVPAPLAHTLTSKYFQMLNNPQQAGNIVQDMKNSIQARVGAQGQQALQTPQYTTNAAGQIVGLQTGPNQISVPGEQGAPQGQPQVAPQGAPQGNIPAQMQNQFAQRQTLNPGTAQAGMVATAAQNLSTDFAKTQETATSSEPRIALFQNIKKLAPEAFTGVGGARKELASGIAQAVGIPAYEAEKMSTDELAKSSAMLSLAGGNTDAARLMAEAANPNKKMNAEAIKQISDQMIGMERMNQAKYKFLAPAQTNPQEYANRLSQFNKINDFRIFQESNPEQVKALKGSMSITEQKIMGDKIRMARQLGLI